MFRDFTTDPVLLRPNHLSMASTDQNTWDHFVLGLACKDQGFFSRALRRCAVDRLKIQITFGGSESVFEACASGR